MSAGKHVIPDHREQPAHGRAPHECRCQQTARSPRSQRYHQRRKLRQHHDQQQLPRQVPVEDVPNRVVSHAQHARYEESDDSQKQRTNRRPPQLVQR